ncbi:MAG: TlpA disulfide reductase family protein [Deltaproteobacteria bacterium]|nr:TlpA disulfide reductase family protein [Deltaproteobacteria bacterium]
MALPRPSTPFLSLRFDAPPWPRVYLGWLALLALSLGSCGSAVDAPIQQTTDAGGVGDAPPLAAGACETGPAPVDWSYPAGPYSQDGRIGEIFEDFTLEDCDGRSVRFGDILAGAQLVLFNVGAGWCQPCIEETEEIEAKVNQPLCPAGLRVVQVLFQDEESLPATKFFCRQWREKFGLTFPVLVDPLFKMERYFEAAQTPLNLGIDRLGVIRLRTVGFPPKDLPEQLGALLTRP